MGKKSRFATSKSAKHFHNWFSGNENWNASKVTTYSKEEYEQLLERERKEAINDRDTEKIHAEK